METTTLSTKGQLILPKDIRDFHAWGPGTEFTIEETKDGILLRPAGKFPKTQLKDVAGCLKSSKAAAQPKTLAEMEKAISKEVRRRHDRRRY